MISLYISQKTWLHRVPAGTKLLALAAISIVVLPVGNILFLALGGCVATGIYLSMGRPGISRLIGLKAMLPLILGLGIFQGFVISWELAALSVTRLLLMIMLADLVTATTPMQEMMRVILPWLRPLRVIGVDPKKLSLAVALVIRFVPVLLAQWQAQSEAWSARSKKRSGFKLIAPFMNETLRRTDHVAEAIVSRIRR
jgi:biotin transport system permease protein